MCNQDGGSMMFIYLISYTSYILIYLSLSLSLSIALLYLIFPDFFPDFPLFYLPSGCDIHSSPWKITSFN